MLGAITLVGTGPQCRVKYPNVDYLECKFWYVVSNNVAFRAKHLETGKLQAEDSQCNCNLILLFTFRIGFYWVTEVVGDAVHIIGVKLLKRGLDPCVRSLMSSFLLHNLTQQSARGLQQ